MTNATQVTKTTIIASGSTYDWRHELKSADFRWDADDKVWIREGAAFVGDDIHHVKDDGGTYSIIGSYVMSHMRKKGVEFSAE